MKIAADRLVGAVFLETPNRGGKQRPELLVLHYTVSWPGVVVAAAFRSPSTKASAHLVLDLDGSLNQMVPFNVQAWHAGVSEWRGRQKVNGFSIGIEIVNPGPVFLQRDGSVKDVNGRAWTGGAELARSERLPAGCPAGWTHWAPYTPDQIGTLVELCPLLCREYQLVDVVSHSEIAPRRKFDPGPLFPLDRLRELCFPRPRSVAPFDAATMPTLKVGSRGPDVRTLQERLACVLVDGDFGPQTRAAVVAFQCERGLLPDGVVGPATWRALA